MIESELGKILKKMYDKALEGEKVVSIHLFGIKYADIIQDNNIKPTDIIKFSGLPESYATEVQKGIKLAPYVIVK